MSRGLGFIENGILKRLKPAPADVSFDWLTAAELATDINAPPASVRRALLSLRRKGLVEAARWMGRLRFCHTAAWQAQKKKKARNERARERARRRADQRRWKRERAHSEALDDLMAQAKRNRPDTAKLALILGMLGSEHPGEVLAAAAAAEAERKRLGRSWPEILRCA